MYFLSSISLCIIPMCIALENPRIAIIGSGIGGTSCVYFLRDLFGENASITLFERDNIGGRLASINVDGDYYEAGGSLIHPKNKYMVEFAKLLGLTPKKDDIGLWGIFNGEEFVFKSSSWTFSTLTKMFWRYGWDTFQLDGFLKNFLGDFSRIYDSQDKGLAFSSVQDMLAHMGPKFPNMTVQSLDYFMKTNGFSDLFIDELVQAVMLGNYGHTSKLPAFVGIMSLAASEPNQWSIKGGNRQVPVGLLATSNARLINADVIAITLEEDRTFKLTYKLPLADSLSSGNFNHVVVATPLIYNFKNIKFLNFTNDFTKYEGIFQRTVSTFVEGKLRNSLFQTSPLPNAVFTNNDSFIFNGLVQCFPVSDNKSGEERNVYRVYSKVPLTEEQIKNLFEDVKVVALKDWLAHPRYELSENIPPFVLYPGLYYTNAIEWAASAIEMSAIAGRNVALLIYNTWNNKHNLIDIKQKLYKDEL